MKNFKIAFIVISLLILSGCALLETATNIATNPVFDSAYDHMNCKAKKDSGKISSKRKCMRKRRFDNKKKKLEGENRDAERECRSYSKWDYTVVTDSDGKKFCVKL